VNSVSIPSGTITFVFTDIEGSTQRWDRDRAAMEAAVRRHDALVREAIAAHNGYVFKTIGDAFCAAFARPEDAVAAMFDALGAFFWITASSRVLWRQRRRHVRTRGRAATARRSPSL
jgi:class 3 adenylate cyclase